MPTYDSFCRTPLVDPAYVVLPDSAVYTAGTLERLIRLALATVDLNALSPLDAVLTSLLQFQRRQRVEVAGKAPA